MEDPLAFIGPPKAVITRTTVDIPEGTCQICGADHPVTWRVLSKNIAPVGDPVEYVPFGCFVE